VEARQLRDHVLAETVGEELLFRITAHIGEGKDGDRRLSGTLPLVALPLVVRSVAPTAVFGRFGADFRMESTNRPADILHRRLADILKRDLNLGRDLIVDTAEMQMPPGSARVEPRGKD